MMRSAWQRPAARVALAALVVVAAALAPHAARAQADLLDGKVFVTTEGDAGKPANAESVVTFAGGQAHNKSCDQWGYGKGDVKARREGDVVHFETETRSDRYDTRQVWRGTVRGSMIEGIRTFYPKPGFFNRNPEPKEIWFKGTLRPD